MSNLVYADLTDKQKESLLKDFQLANTALVCVLFANYWYFEADWTWTLVGAGIGWSMWVKDILNNAKHFQILNAMQDSKD